MNVTYKLVVETVPERTLVGSLARKIVTVKGEEVAYLLEKRLTLIVY